MRIGKLVPSLVFGLALVACGDDIKGQLDPDASVDDADGAVAPDGAVALLPTIAAVDYPVITHGGQLVISGENLEGATEVSIGGVVHTNLTDVATDSVTVIALDPSVAVALATPLTVTTPSGTSDPLDVTVIHLLISEIDPDTVGADNAEFIELDIGLAAAVSLDGYLLALFQGNSALGDTLNAIDLNATTSAAGLLLVGAAALSPQVVFAGPIDQGEDAVAVFQFAGAVGTFPANFNTIGESGLIDGVIWESGADDVTADFSLLLADDVVVNEGNMSAERELVSIQRCLADITPRTGGAFGLLAPSPGLANGDCSL